LAHDGRPAIDDHQEMAAAWSGADWAATAAWFVAALAARAPFVARIEGALDSDQSVVGLMALDIAEGRRFPVFFDGQRYMGAVEAYVAAGFVRAFGHAPIVVALAPLLFFGLFVAGQFAVWRLWNGRATGHLAAALTVLGAPLMTLWGVIPRGGYVELLAWALPTLAVYRAVVRPGRAPLSAWRQAAFGFLLAVGYFVNPLSLVVYVTLALDWTFARHGADLRRRHGGLSSWPQGAAALVVGPALAAAWLSALAFCCHVDPFKTPAHSPYVFLGILDAGRPTAALGALGAAGFLVAAGWWSGASGRAYRTLAAHPWFLLGALLAWSPFVIYAVRTKLGGYPPDPALPVWFGAPWKIGPNAGYGLGALGPLLGCDPRALETALISEGVEPPPSPWPCLDAGLLALSPLTVAAALALLARVAWQDRRQWVGLAALRGEGPAPPSCLALGVLGVTVALYLLQGTSPNGSSVRYLVPAWVALPGLLAVALRGLPRSLAWSAALLLVAPWGVAQGALWGQMGQPSPARPLAAELTRSGVTAVVAPTPVAVALANLTHGRVGGLEPRSIWNRIGARYRDRFEAGKPVVCVVDQRFPWAIRGEGAWSPDEDFGLLLRGLAGQNPGRVRLVREVNRFEIWEVDLDLSRVLGDGAPRTGGEPNALAGSDRPAGLSHVQ
jgi:hypothetical protein